MGTMRYLVSELWPQVQSDLSALHRVDDPADLPAPRLATLALNLHCYQGAVAAHLAAEQEQQASTRPDISADPTFAPYVEHARVP